MVMHAAMPKPLNYALCDWFFSMAQLMLDKYRHETLLGTVQHFCSVRVNKAGNGMIMALNQAAKQEITI